MAELQKLLEQRRKSNEEAVVYDSKDYEEERKQKEEERRNQGGSYGETVHFRSGWTAPPKMNGWNLNAPDVGPKAADAKGNVGGYPGSKNENRINEDELGTFFAA